MKALIPVPKYLALAFAILALAGWIAIPSSALAQSKGAGAAKLTKSTAVSDSQNASTVAANNKAKGWCSNCRISLVKVAERPTKIGAAAEAKLITRNECSMCVNALAAVGSGKLAKATLTNSCEECCEMDPKCCETNPICCMANAGGRLARPAVMARN